MADSFVTLLAVGGKTNSLGRAEEVIQTVLANQSRLPELYDCLFDDNAWVRMRAMDSFEKICRQHPAWIEPYLDRMGRDLATSTQPSILWHLAQIYSEVKLTPKQQAFALTWLENQLATTDVDWIVASNCMSALVEFCKRGAISAATIRPLLSRQQAHHSKAVARRATKLLDELSTIT